MKIKVLALKLSAFSLTICLEFPNDEVREALKITLIDNRLRFNLEIPIISSSV